MTIQSSTDQTIHDQQANSISPQCEPIEINQSQSRHGETSHGADRLVLRVGSEFFYTSTHPTSAIIQIHARPEPLAITDTHVILWQEWKSEPHLPIRTYFDQFGNLVVRTVLPVGESRFSYDARVEVSALPDTQTPGARGATVDELPDEVLVYTLSSRYCLSDVVSDFAWQTFGHVPMGWPRVQAICDWLHTNIQYQTGASNPWTTAKDVLDAGQGICRDFAHTGITLCRALNIPARYVFGYFPDIDVEPPDVPMDFHAWFEVWLDGRWHTFDARHNVPRIGRIPIARGRDAVDCAMVTSYGAAILQTMRVWADDENESAEPPIKVL